jgi:ferredoxin
MSKITEIAAKLLQQGDVEIVIGYTEGKNGIAHSYFARNEEEAQKLIYNQACLQNLAVYLYKKETANKGKQAIIANIPTLRSIIRLAAENQLKDGDVIAIAVNDAGDVQELRTLDEIENYLAATTPKLSQYDQLLLDKITAMTPDERWNFWETEMENCIRCYACRQSCPLCYCNVCSVEMNQPQWVPVEASVVGNLEWHIMRAMHLSGRCVECGQCGRACPMNIPIHLLPIHLAEEVQKLYGTVTGMKREERSEMSTYLPDDKETFIG